LKSQSIHFLNDDDINGNPIVQTKAFSDSLKTELQTNTSELNSLITDHFDRPNKRMRITDGTNTSTYGSNFITINNSSYTDLGVNIPAGTFSLTKGISSPRIVFTNATLQLLVDASSSLGCIILTQGGDIRIIPKTQTIHIGTIRLQGNLQMESTAQISNAIMTGNVSFSSATSIEGLNKSHVNLDQVNNTSDLDKPISTATQSALNLKANLNSPSFTGTVTGITQTMVGLGNVNNTSDVNKPISSATQSALNLKANLASPSFSGSVIMNSLEVSGTALSLINVLNSSSFAGFFMGAATANGQLNGMVQTNDSVIMSKGTPSGSSTGNGQGFGKLTIATWSAFRNGIRITANETYNAGLDVWQDNGNKIEIECGASKYTQTASAFSVNKDFSITGNLSVTGSVTGITKSSVGLGNVDNTSDLNKPVSTATQSALNLKADLASPTFTGTVSGITKSMVGLSNVDNTSDANKPVSTATQTALNLKANLASPTFTGTVSGITKSMVGLSNVDNTSDADKPVSTATQTALNLKANLASPTFTGTVSGITKSMVGLSNVDNTSDADKPVSTATQSALNLKANLASPTFTGTVSGITKSMVGLSNVDNTSDTDKPVSTATQTALNSKLTVGADNANLIIYAQELYLTRSTAFPKANFYFAHDSSSAGYLKVDSPSGASALIIQVNNSSNTPQDALLVNTNAIRVKKPILPDYNVQPSSNSHLGWVASTPTEISIQAPLTNPISSQNAERHFGRFTISSAGYYHIIVQINLAPNVNHTSYDQCMFCLDDTQATFPSVTTMEKYTQSVVSFYTPLNSGLTTSHYINFCVNHTSPTTPVCLNFRLVWGGGGTVVMKANYSLVRIG
jgi:hypothetical protein